MANSLQLKRHIKSAKNIGQVTRALEMVSAVKMRKAQAESLAGHPYTDHLVTAIRSLNRSSELDHPYLRSPASVSKIMLVIVAPHKGLAGSLISGLSRQVLLFTNSLKSNRMQLEGRDYSHKIVSPVQLDIVTWGKKSRSIAAKTGFSVLADFYADIHIPVSEHISALSSFITDYFKNQSADLIIIAHNRFINTMTQSPVLTRFLPLIDMPDNQQDLGPIYQFEPDKTRLFISLMDHYVYQLLTQIILDSFAAEHSARMIAMKNAHENAENIVNDFTLMYNKIRQSVITNEIADNVSGSISSNY